MQELLVNVGPRDPLVFGTTLTALFVTGVVASVVPALKAASVDPATALKRD